MMKRGVIGYSEDPMVAAWLFVGDPENDFRVLWRGNSFAALSKWAKDSGVRLETAGQYRTDKGRNR